jgi:hypothetical protein
MTMTLTVDLKPEVEAGLSARARAKGVSLAEYVRSLLEQFAQSGPPMTGEQRVHAMHEWAKGFPQVAPLSDEAISRESPYSLDQ